MPRAAADPAKSKFEATRAKPDKWIDFQHCNRNGIQLVQQGLHAIVRVAQSEDMKYVLPAGQWLVSYGEGLMREQAAKAGLPAAAAPALLPESRDQLLRDLQGLYAKALGNSKLVEAVAEPEPSEKQS